MGERARYRSLVLLDCLLKPTGDTTIEQLSTKIESDATLSSPTRIDELLDKLYGLVRKTMDMINGECPLHHVPLVRGPVAIQYGLRYLSNEYRAARNKLFPKAVSFMNGGCCVSKDSPRTMYVHYCEQCRAAEKEWKEANPEDPLRALKERFNIPTDPSQRLTGLDLEWTLHKMDRGHLHPGLDPDAAPNPDARDLDSPNPDSPSGRDN